MFSAKLYFNEECQISFIIDPDTKEFSIVEESSGYAAEGQLESDGAKKPVEEVKKKG